MNFFEKGVFYVLPIIGASLSFLDMAFLLNTAYHRGLVAYHSWLFKCSRFAVWVSFLALYVSFTWSNMTAFPRYIFYNSLLSTLQALIILALKCPCGSSIFCNRVLCFWWAIKPLFMIPNLQATFRSLEVTLVLVKIFLIIMCWYIQLLYQQHIILVHVVVASCNVPAQMRQCLICFHLAIWGLNF